MAMHPALQRLIEANTALEQARLALQAAEDHRRQCAVGLSAIADEEERWQAALYAYCEFGKGLTNHLAEGATGIPGKRSASVLLTRAGKFQNRGQIYYSDSVVEDPQPKEWPLPDALERDLIRSHIAHRKPYQIDEGIGWTRFMASLAPDEAAAYLDDPSAALAKHFEMSREEFIEWLSTDGFVRCEATTRKGTQCQSGVAGLRSQLDIKPWKIAKDRGGYCRQHGG